MTSAPSTYLGLDFSGGAAPWKAQCPKPSVWIATVEGCATPPMADLRSADFRLVDLRPVQALPGAGGPFDRLAALLRDGAFAAAAIDAPFAIPAEHLPPGGQPALLARIAALPSAGDRPFPRGDELVRLAEEVAPLRRLKPLRDTERHWNGRGVNARSTLWNGARAGAPFAMACLTLLARAGRPIWPWACGPGMLVEAFPAAQLRQWGLPHQGYSKPEQRDQRRAIVGGLERRVHIPAALREIMLDSQDALDAVVAAFAGLAAERRGLPSDAPADGLIAVLGDNETQATRPVTPANLLAAPADAGGHEIFEDILRRPGLRIERIVSRGHTTTPTTPYVQDHDEWVLVLRGTARLVVGDAPERTLTTGEHLLIPAGVPHRVTHTAEPTIWLAIHVGG